MREVPDSRLGPLTGALCVGTAGVAGRLMVNGLSVSKVYGQTGVPGGQTGFLRNLFLIRKLHGGNKGFFRGSVAAGTRIFPHYAIQITVYDQLSKAWTQRPYSSPPSDTTLVYSWYAGAVSGLVATSVTHPLDVIKIRMMVQPSGKSKWYKTPLDAWTKILHQEGIFRGLYRGLLPSLVGSAIFSGNVFALLEYCDNLPWVARGVPFTRCDGFVFSCFGVAAAVAVSHPFDVIRRKCMLQSAVLPRSGGVDVKFENWLQFIRTIFKYSNIHGFYFGVTANLLKVVPQVGVFWMVYRGVTETAAAGTSAISLKI